MQNLRQIHRGLMEKKRLKRWKFFKNRGLQEQYTNRFKEKPVELKDVLEEIKVPEIPKKLVWWRKIIDNIKKFFRN